MVRSRGPTAAAAITPSRTGPVMRRLASAARWSAVEIGQHRVHLEPQLAPPR